MKAALGKSWILVGLVLALSTQAEARGPRSERTCDSLFQSDQMSIKVSRALDRSRAGDLEINYNGSYYVMGLEGLAHERSASHMIVDRLLRPGQKFLFLGVSGNVFTPGIDGTIFRESVLEPESRVTLKSIQSFKSEEQLGHKMVSITRSATAQAEKYSNFVHVYGAIFPPFKPKELREWLHRPGRSFFGRVGLMAAMGLKSKPAPLKVVLSIEGVRSGDFPSLPQYFSEGLRQYSQGNAPDSVVLIFIDRVLELRLGVDY